ncbi:MAG: cyclase family protein, partial [Pseudomonadota bacterium]|nr:cyclase family protein [Pseudomonadota bacterium]
ENMVTDELAEDGVTEFFFSLGVPRLEGTVQAIINPVAVR